MDVFPVCLSPTINSLCPNPIGTIESMHNIPVDNDSDTVSLVIIPADGASTIHLVLGMIGLHTVVNDPVDDNIDPRI